MLQLTSVPLGIIALLVVDLPFRVLRELILLQEDSQWHLTAYHVHQVVTVLMKDCHKYLVCAVMAIIVRVVMCYQILQCTHVKLVLCALKVALCHKLVVVEHLPIRQVNHFVNNVLRDSTVYL